jgi:phage FluMu gp28-like protein
MVGIWRMRKHPYPAQINRLKTFAASFKDCMTVWHDKTGVGVALDDMLANSELPYRGFTFTNASKNEFMVKLMVSFEQASIKIPQIDHIIDELNDIEVTASLTGLPRYAAIEGSTDDIVMSMGLGHAAMLEYCDRDFSVIEF